MLMRSPTHYRRRGLRHFWIAISLWLARRRERLALSRLDDRLLDDVGLKPDEASNEWRKPWWKP